MQDSEKVINLLWTGGWDSTFRLLQILLKEKKKVQPYYLKFSVEKTNDDIMPVRKSTENELRVMRNMQKKLFEEYPHTQKLLLPLIEIDASIVKPDMEILQAYKEIIKESYIGNQYIWLAGFSKQFGLKDLEMSIENNGHTYELLIQYVEKDRNSIYNLIRENTPGSVYSIFQYFSFPLLEYSKKDMNKESSVEKWNKIMSMTWFCHKPYLGKFACGSCNPCVQTYKDGMGWRIPIFFRVFGRIFKKIYNSKSINKLRNVGG